MTTIRTTRLPRPAPGDPPEQPRPRTPATAGDPGDSVRLTMEDAAPGERRRLDGAWWPHSQSLAEELPALVTELHRRGFRTSRVTYNPEQWSVAPRRLEADGRVIRLGWFRSIDRHLLNLSGGDDGRSRLDLLVVPPETGRETAARAMAAAGERGNQQSPTALLAGLGGPVPGPRAAPAPPSASADPDTGGDGVAAGDSEGGHLSR